jgi:hypothetical protein
VVVKSYEKLVVVVTKKVNLLFLLNLLSMRPYLNLFYI